MEIVLRNIILGISLAAPLGPAGIAVIQNGLSAGFLRGFLTGFGVTLADATYLLVVFFGLSSLLGDTITQVILLSLGSLALIYFGVRGLRQAGADFDLAGMQVSTAKNPLALGYIVNVSNPISVVWWLGVFGSLLTEAGPETSRLEALGISATILVGILLWHTTLSTLSHWGRRLLNPKFARAISILAGVALILFGLRFGYRAFITARGA